MILFSGTEMGASQSSAIKTAVPEVAMGNITFLRDKADTDASGMLVKIVDAVAEFDVKDRMANKGVVDRDCCGIPRSFDFVDGSYSGSEVLKLYKEVLAVKPMSMERGGCTSNPTKLLDRVIYAKVVPPRECCIPAKDLVRLCLLGPCCFPCLACVYFINKCGESKEKVTVSKIEKAKSLMSSLKAIDKYVSEAPNSKGCCCWVRNMNLDRASLKLYLRFLILDEIDIILTDMMGSMSNIDSVINDLLPLLSPKAQEDLRKKIRDLRESEQVRAKERENNPEERFDAEQQRLNKEYREFLLGQRVCRDFIGNDLLQFIFTAADEKIPVGNSVNFIASKIMPNDPAEIAKLIMYNFNALKPSKEKFLPAEVEPIVILLRKELGAFSTTIRVKEASHVFQKNLENESERLKGTQDLLGLRLFISNQRVFDSFGKATIAAYKIKEMPGVANVIVSHKLKYTTGFIDFKIIVELSLPGSPFFEIQIVPAANFILDEAVGGHEQHKNSNKIA